jgi:hypothetical protein
MWRWERMSSLRGLMMEDLQKVVNSWVIVVVRERWMARMSYCVLVELLSYRVT